MMQISILLIAVLSSIIVLSDASNIFFLSDVSSQLIPKRLYPNTEVPLRFYWDMNSNPHKYPKPAERLQFVFRDSKNVRYSVGAGSFIRKSPETFNAYDGVLQTGNLPTAPIALEICVEDIYKRATHKFTNNDIQGCTPLITVAAPGPKPHTFPYDNLEGFSSDSFRAALADGNYFPYVPVSVYEGQKIANLPIVVHETGDVPAERLYVYLLSGMESIRIPQQKITDATLQPDSTNFRASFVIPYLPYRKVRICVGDSRGSFGGSIGCSDIIHNSRPPLGSTSLPNNVAPMGPADPQVPPKTGLRAWMKSKFGKAQ